MSRIGACGDPIYCGAGFYFGGVFYDEVLAHTALTVMPDGQVMQVAVPAYQVSLTVIPADQIEQVTI